MNGKEYGKIAVCRSTSGEAAHQVGPIDMREVVRKSLFLAGASLLLPMGAAAQETGPENLLPAVSSNTSEPEATPDYDAPTQGSVEQAFDESFETVQQIDAEVQPWTVQQAQDLVALIEGIGTEGLDPQDYDAVGLRTVMAQGASPALDAAASQRFIWLVEDMRDGRTPMAGRKQWFVMDPDADRYRSGTVLKAAVETGDLVGALESVAPLHPDYLVLKEALAKAQPGSTRFDKIRANMDRWRWLPRVLGNQYLITNVPEFQLRLTVNDKIMRTYRTIVGKPGRTATPQLAEVVEGVIFNPTWTVPQSIVKGEGLGARVLGNPAWARSKGYTATKGANGWVSVVQESGPGNALGKMKLDMPNRHAIFLHDTPSRGLFNNAARALSHGCIRTERATELAMTLAILQAGLTADEGVEKLTSGKYTRVGFDKKMPVYITYFTMATDIEGELSTFNDLYERDAPVMEAFANPRVANRSRVTDEQIIVIEDDPRAIG